MEFLDREIPVEFDKDEFISIAIFHPYDINNSTRKLKQKVFRPNKNTQTTLKENLFRSEKSSNRFKYTNVNKLRIIFDKIKKQGWVGIALFQVDRLETIKSSMMTSIDDLDDLKLEFSPLDINNQKYSLPARTTFKGNPSHSDVVYFMNIKFGGENRPFPTSINLLFMELSNTCKLILNNDPYEEYKEFELNNSNGIDIQK